MELEIYGVFREAGIEEKSAKAIAATINKALEQNIYSKELATKGDIDNVRLELRTEIARVEANIIKWIVGALFAAAGVGMAIARLFLTSH
ncbi:MAG: CCDC90 family protein [Proteobacteria bacterium]|nr:CCDC90 family protein [Pseudomonadota bacterium]